ncbi:MAG: DNA repair exonuclease [Gemmatimonadales bacterium]|nr:DNA repair exonuclease [Gemmatimonadales bacterium]
MRIAHVADPHLGFRQYTRLTSRGLNQREADVATAFGRAIDGVIASAPDVVIVAGDIFHSVRPTNSAILFAFRQLARLVDRLPGVPVIAIAGNHDTPRSTDTVSIFGLFHELGIHVVHDDARRLDFPERGLSVLAVPHQALFREPRLAFEPAGQAPHQVLVLHGETPGLFGPDRGGAEPGGAFLSTEELTGGDWSYVALGHYHVQHQVRERIWYAGALDYVSPNPWGELREERERAIPGKGWLLADLASGTVTPHFIEPPRRVIDLRTIDAGDFASAELDRMLEEAVESVPGAIDDAVVRQVVINVPRTMARELDHAEIRNWKARALHFQLDLRRPEAAGRVVGIGAPGTRQTLPEIVAAHLAARPLPASVDREAFVRVGTDLMTTLEQDTQAS